MATSRRSGLRSAKAPHRAHGGPKPTRIGNDVEVIRCNFCNKKLAEADYRQLSIKCPRCGAINNLKAIEPPECIKSMQKVRPDAPDP